MRRDRVALVTFSIVCGLVLGCGSPTGSKLDGSGGSGGSGGRDAASDASADTLPTGFCSTADDCVPKVTGPCCGFCLNVDDPPLPASACPTGTVVCVAVPTACACVDHQCVSTTNAGDP